MQTILIPSKVKRGETEGHKEATPSRYTTTLYALLAAIQDVVGLEDDAQVVATVVYLLRSGRLTWRGQARACPGSLRCSDGSHTACLLPDHHGDVLVHGPA
jgi:hypothetical protein